MACSGGDISASIVACSRQGSFRLVLCHGAGLGSKGPGAAAASFGTACAAAADLLPRVWLTEVMPVTSVSHSCCKQASAAVDVVMPVACRSYVPTTAACHRDTAHFQTHSRRAPQNLKSHSERGLKYRSIHPSIRLFALLFLSNILFCIRCLPTYLHYLPTHSTPAPLCRVCVCVGDTCMPADVPPHRCR